MLNEVIRFSLQHRALVLVAAALLVVYGSFVIADLPVDVLPDINRPVVTIMTEAHGLAPEEVEILVTFRLETVLNGATDVERVRSISAPGLSIVYVEFDWDANVYVARQIVSERLQMVSNQLPAGMTPVMGPVTSLMGAIQLLALRGDDDVISELDLRTFADWTLRPRLLAIPGVAQVVNLGGGVKQYQVLLNPQQMRDYSISLQEIERAVALSNTSTSGGFLNQAGREFTIRNMGRIQTLDDLRNTVVGLRGPSPIHLSDIARIVTGPRVKRGEASFNGRHSVIVQITKQPGANTVELTRQVEKALEEIQSALPPGLIIENAVFRQADFIETAVGNVLEALRDGSILVMIVFFLFLLSFRTTVITLTAIPLSFVITAIVMKLLGVGINTMTLGGLAIAIGELVDDAIVDVENVFRRLRQNRDRPQPDTPLKVIYQASSEIRNSIVYATIIIILVFLPLFYLGGVEGRLFQPLGLAYVVSILASLVVALTVTPVLCYYLFRHGESLRRREDSWLVMGLKGIEKRVLGFTLENPWAILLGAAVLVLLALSMLPLMGREFLPPFNEGSFTVLVLAPPGTSLPESDRLGTRAERIMLEIPEVVSTGRRTGRAELDEHAEGVYYNEIEVTLAPGRRKDEIAADIRDRLSEIPNVDINVGQPISHRIDHLLSGSFSEIAVKIFGEDMHVLRNLAERIEAVMRQVDGVEDLYIEQQVSIPQIRISVQRQAAARYGLAVQEITEPLETVLNGRVITEVLEKQQSFEVLLRMDEPWRDKIDFLEEMPIDLAAGGKIPLSYVARISLGEGPNQILRENGLRRLVVQCNVAGRDLGSVVDEIRVRVADQVDLPEGYFLSYGGQFESQIQATRIIGLLAIISVTAVFILLYGHFRLVRIALQIMANLPLALIGAVVAIFITGGTLSVATLVGFVTLFGIAARNGVMMISHYLHLMKHEGEPFDRTMIVRGTLERLVPVTMTALTTTLALIPLAFSQEVPGKEILHPVAVVILGGLISSTLLDMVVTPALFYKFGRPIIDRIDRSVAI